MHQMKHPSTELHNMHMALQDLARLVTASMFEFRNTSHSLLNSCALSCSLEIDEEEQGDEEEE